MVHIELSLSPTDVAPDFLPSLRVVPPPGPLAGWLDAVGSAEEPCLLLDAGGVMIGVSASCVGLLGAASEEELLGRGLLEDVIDLVGFHRRP